MSSSNAASTEKLRVVRPKRVYEQIAQQIQDLILNRDLAPGDRLPAERELAATLGVSRPSVREAMIALEGAGFVEIRTGEGSFVRDPQARRIDVPWAGDRDPGPGPLEQFEARRLVEPELATRAAVMATGSEIDHLDQLVEEMARVYPTLGDFDDKLGHQFHTALARTARNGVLAQLVQYLWDLRDSDMWRRLRRRVVNPDNRRKVVEDRRRLVAALRDHDPGEARAAMNALLDRAEARYFGEEEPSA